MPLDSNQLSESPCPVFLVSMPFGPLQLPSIGLSLLRGALRADDIESVVRYFTFPFASIIGQRCYLDISNGRPSTCHLVGEWIFAGTLFQQSAEQEAAYIRDILRSAVPASGIEYDRAPPAAESFIDEVRVARAAAESFLDDCLAEIVTAGPRIVGFTSSFQQQVASLALARRLKRSCPEITIVFGGANVEGAMGRQVVEQFRFVDAVVSGEAEIAFPSLVRRLLDNQPLVDIEGVFTRAQLPMVSDLGTTQRVAHMDELPCPDYDDFFAQATQCDGLDDCLQVLFETSRGCWWGDKQHCTFCGLNGATMAFRSKTANRALEELRALAIRYPSRPVQVVDNILDMRYFRDFIPALANERLDVELFYEVKANLRKDQLTALAAAGILRIQPGIESLSTPVLKLMRKGITAIQNVQLLKWCKELGIRPAWNLLWGFPGESPSDYHEMAQLLPLLAHLPPPTAASPLRLDRFSPLFENQEAAGITAAGPVPAYGHIYSDLDATTQRNLAYYFGYSYIRPQAVAQYTEGLVEQVDLWRSGYDATDLVSNWVGDRMVIWDLRDTSESPITVLSGPTAELYSQCDTLHSTVHLAQNLDRDLSARAKSTPERVADLASPLIARGLMMAEADKLLSLAIPWGSYRPSAAARQKFDHLVRSHAQPQANARVIPASTMQYATI